MKRTVTRWQTHTEEPRSGAWLCLTRGAYRWVLQYLHPQSQQRLIFSVLAPAGGHRYLIRRFEPRAAGEEVWVYRCLDCHAESRSTVYVADHFRRDRSHYDFDEAGNVRAVRLEAVLA